MSPLEQQPEGEGDLKERDKTDDVAALSFVQRAAAKAVAVLFALALSALWLYICSVVELALDYPIRRAGESDVYPARGTAAFWWNCLIQVSKISLVAYVFGGLLIVPAICFFFYYGFSIRSRVACLIIALVPVSCPYIYGYLHIRFYSSWYKADAFWVILRKLLHL